MSDSRRYELHNNNIRVYRNIRRKRQWLFSDIADSNSMVSYNVVNKTSTHKTKTKTETEVPSKHKRNVNVNIIESQIKAVMYHE